MRAVQCGELTAVDVSHLDGFGERAAGVLREALEVVLRSVVAPSRAVCEKYVAQE